MTTHADYDVVVIGSGVGGLAAAGVLAHRGYKTAIFEQAPRIGGCCGSVKHGDYQFDVGATVVLFLDVIEQYFASVGRNMSDFVSFAPIEPLYEVLTRSGKRWQIPTDPEATAEIYRSLSKADGEGWDRFAERSVGGIGKALTQIMTTPLQTMADAMKVYESMPALKADSIYMLKNFETTLRSFFKDEDVLGAMSLQSYNVGLPPALAPGYAAFLTYSEHEGCYYPRGGMKAIPEGMAAPFEQDGGEIHLNSPVDAILTEGRRAVGIRLKDGREVRAHRVVSDINARVVYEHMLRDAPVPWWARAAIRSYAPSQSSLMLALGLEGQPDLKTHHSFCSTGLEAMNRIWFDDYEKGRPCHGGYLLASMPSVTDRTLAPDGHHVLHLHTLAPYELKRGSWDALREQEMEGMLDVLENDFGVGIRDRIRFSQLNTPVDYERKVGLHRGAVYGIENGLLATAAFRPRMRSGVIEGLYLAGSSVHLGGGIPVCIGSGLIVADLVGADQPHTATAARPKKAGARAYALN